jgi:hypothetical protein
MCPPGEEGRNIDFKNEGRFAIITTSKQQTNLA